MNLFEITSFVANICIIAGFAWLIAKYLKIKKYAHRYMDIDKILDDIESLDHGEPTNESAIFPPTVDAQGQLQAYKERLIAVAASGNAKLYLGKNITTSDIENLEDKEVMKLYSRYETYIGSVMTKSLKSAICGAYTTLMSVLVPSVSKGRYMLVEGERLSESLIENPVINLTLSTYTCKLYHNYGHYLAPLTAGLLTSGHVKEAPLQAKPEVPEKDLSNVGQVSE